MEWGKALKKKYRNSFTPHLLSMTDFFDQKVEMLKMTSGQIELNIDSIDTNTKILI